MKAGGVVTKDNLNVKQGADDITVTLKTPTKEEPQWEKLTVQTTGAKAVEYTPVDKEGKKSGETTSQVVTDNSKPTEVVLSKPETASGFIVKPIPATPDSKPTVDVVSAVACAAAKGRLL